ncbi:hypothetical protein D3C73_1147290 [compost metagenome]
MGKHNCPCEIIHLQSDFFFNTARNICQLICQNNLAIRSDLNKPTDRVADGQLILPLEATFNPVTLRAGSRRQFECKRDEQRILGMIHDSLSSAKGTSHLTVHSQSNSIQNGRFTTAGWPKYSEQTRVAQRRKIYFLHFSIALQTG